MVYRATSELDELEPVKKSKGEDRPYCTISCSEPSAVTLYKPYACVVISRIYLKVVLTKDSYFQELPNKPNNVNGFLTVNALFVLNAQTILTDLKRSKENNI